MGHQSSVDDVTVTLRTVADGADDTLLEGSRTQGDPDASEHARASNMTVGDAIGRYVVIGTLGVGGMGVVHAAYDPELDRKLAIKLLRNVDRGDRHHLEIRARLRREAQAIAKLSHPNVVAVHDVGLHQGQVFVAMEFVDGGTLGDWMRGPELAGGRFTPRPWREVLAHFIATGQGLAAAHAAGIVHRDFKPANVLLGTDGRPRIADFGIARSVEGGDSRDSELDLATGELAELSGGPSTGRGADASEELELGPNSSTLTRTGALIGTPAYMAPEQFRNAHVDARADQFAFCVAFYEALYGLRPFPGTSLAQLILAVTEGSVREPPREPPVPAWLSAIVLRGLANDPADRWPDMVTLLEALQHRPRRRGRLVAMGALALAGFSAAAALAFSDPAAPAHCTGVDDSFGDFWSPADKAEVAANLVARTTPGVREAATHVIPRLDDWADRWREGWVDACEATHVRGEQSEELLDRRMSCLQRQRRRMQAFIELLGTADDELARTAIDGLDNLDDVSRCADVDALMTEVAAPEDPSTRERVDALSQQLDPVHAALAAGEWDVAQAKLEPLETEVTRLGWLPLEAELAYLRGELARGERSLEAGEAAYRQAFVDALKVGDERLAAKARRDLAGLIAEWESRHDEALELLREAEALALHLDDDALLASVYVAQTTTLELRGDFDEALAAARRSAEALTRAHGPHGPGSAKLAEVRYLESMILYRLGRKAEAREALAQARAGFGDDYGPNHPTALNLLNAAGVLALADANWAEAEARFAELLDRRQNIFGPDHLDVSDALANLGGAQYNAGEFEAAERSYARALEIREREMGPSNLYVGHTLANLAVVYGRMDQHELAEQTASRALAIIAEVRGPRHHDTMIAHGLLAEVALLGGDDELALQELLIAHELSREAGSPAQRLELGMQVANVRVHLGELGLAEAELDRVAQELASIEDVPAQMLTYEYLRARLADARGEATTAAEHVARARAHLGEARSSGVGLIEEAEAWLAEQPH